MVEWSPLDPVFEVGGWVVVEWSPLDPVFEVGGGCGGMVSPRSCL